MTRGRIHVEKLLCLALRHHPETLCIAIDAQGYTPIDALCAALAARRVALTIEELRALAADPATSRFALSPDGRSLRAQHGHSLDVDLGYPPTPPPPALFHGTIAAALPAIRAAGLVRGERRHVHLSPDAIRAAAVARRRGPAVILTIAAASLAATGHAFMVAPNGVWLTEGVPAQFIAVE
ncbi:MAG: RNA 2'-phosphotransferase [Deltaproteobacteria bacterium]|nr:RNA 2'-phosphotransferase [Deltaproteobacteria bacterium]